MNGASLKPKEVYDSHQLDCSHQGFGKTINNDAGKTLFRSRLMEDMMDNADLMTKLRRASVGIAGAGGLGSNAAMALARAGVGRLVIVDFDEVEKGNLNRQHFYTEQVGMMKTEALARNIRAAVGNCRVDIVNEKLKSGAMESPFTDVDVIVEALDNAETKARFIEEILLKLPEKPVVAASGVAGIGGAERITVLHSGSLWLIQDGEAKSSEDDVVLAPKVGLMAHWQADIVLQILGGGT